MEKVNIDTMQFGFMSGRGTSDDIFIVRQPQERYSARRRELHCIFVNLEKAFDRVHRDTAKWATGKLVTEEWLIITMYEGARAHVRVYRCRIE